MKWFNRTLVIGITTLSLIAFAILAHASTATGSFKYDFTNNPACSATVVMDCIIRFEIWDITNQPAKKLSNVAVPTTIATTQPQVIPFTFSFPPPYGNRVWAVQAVANDRDNVNVTSDINAPQASAPVKVIPGSPTIFIIVNQ